MPGDDLVINTSGTFDKHVGVNRAVSISHSYSGAVLEIIILSKSTDYVHTAKKSFYFRN